jgi:hypothetical protein
VIGSCRHLITTVALRTVVYYYYYSSRGVMLTLTLRALRRALDLAVEIDLTMMTWVREPDHPVTGYTVPVIRLYLDNL